MDILGFILGRRLANREQSQRKIGAFEGVPAMGLDGLGSSAYGPEAALTILIPLGAASLSWIGWIMGPIIILLAILAASYWQTIQAYPNNGGAYVVSRENLGTAVSLLAAASLMIDYVLNVAVGISAGVAALVSAVPTLHAYMLPICLAILAVITIVNLRGTQDSGRLFALPTYLFIISFLGIIAAGVYKAAVANGQPTPVMRPSPFLPAIETAGLWLLLRAFASGCTAMTGVEAVSNGMSAFRDPSVKYGHRTLAAIVGILGVLLAGIAWLATAYRIAAMDQTMPGYQSVLSQLAGSVIGRGWIYYVAMGSLLCVLCLSANTSFVAFPRLCRTVAQDGFLPKPFAIAGRRLVYSVGIIYLALTAGALLTVFGGITDRLIPLFAIGAFLTFTLSQSGMVIHWRRVAKSTNDRLHMAINIVGALTTGAALVVIVIAKFVEGAWITLVAIPCVIVLLKSVHRYYEKIAKMLAVPARPKIRASLPPIVIVAVAEWNRLAAKAMAFALSFSPDVIGLHLARLAGPDTDENLRALKDKWHRSVVVPARKAGLGTPRLVITPARYRTIEEPLLKLVTELEETSPNREIAVLIPEVIKTHWYQYLLHTGYADHLRAQLLRRGGSHVTVISVPWQLEDERQQQTPSIPAN